jgi:kumamolisin
VAEQNNVIPVPGSERAPLPGARAVGPTNPDERLSVTVRLRPKQPITPRVESQAAVPPRQRPHLSREEFEQEHGSDPRDLEQVARFARNHNLEVVESSAARHSVVLAGRAADMQAAFGVQLQQYEHPLGRYRGRTGHVHVPRDLDRIVTGVFGLDDRPQAQPRFRSAEQARVTDPRRLPAGTFTPPQVAQLYNFPEGDGRGQCIGLIELGGGFLANDLSTYFAQLGISSPPQVIAVSVDGGQNQPGGSADGEVDLDIEVAGAVAPGARIVVYFAPNTDRGFLDAVTTAVHDTQNNPSVISISWGNPEVNWTDQAMQNMDQAFQSAAALGVTVCCAAGDAGSADGINDGQQHADFPASSPYALGCGGTSVQGASSTITNESVWNDQYGATGGAISTFFPLPSWQTAVNVPQGPGGFQGRGVPDVAGDADPATGYLVRVDGSWGIEGGTSAVAPLWAGLIALLNQNLGTSVGYLNPQIYTVCSGTFHDIAQGNNDANGIGVYVSGPGWDACTGLGSPDGAQLRTCLGP